MKRNAYVFPLLALALGLLGGCSSKPSADEAKKAAPATDKIQGKLQLLPAESATDKALNGGGDTSAFLWVGARRFRLFLTTRPELVHGDQYAVEGIWAQKLIDEIGDPANGANGYPLDDSCRKAVTTVWKNLAFDALDAQTGLVCSVIKRRPARPLFLVTKIAPAVLDEAAKKKAEADKKRETKPIEITVTAEKQKALLLESPPVQTAPLFQAKGGSETCKVYIDDEGMVHELLSGRPLCEATDWSKYRYKPTLQGGKPVWVNSEVEVKFEPRK
jgi:hypothetical protein